MDEFHGIWIHLARFEKFDFLQKSSLSSFAGFTKLQNLIFAYKWVDLIGLGNMNLNLDLLDEFHGNKIHLARFENIGFLQKSSVSSFAGFTENSKS